MRTATFDHVTGRTGSRPTAPAAARVTPGMVRDYAEQAGVCVRPLLRKVTDRETGQTTTVVIRCGSTREAICPPCADRARRLRMQQCAEGWHLEDDPLPPPDPGEDGATSDQPQDEGQGGDETGEETGDGDDGASGRRVRSTRRRSDVVDLPKQPQEHRSVGRTFIAPDGTVYRPSMFVTLTLGSYGKVIAGAKHRHVPGAGTPVDPGCYGYRRAAVEAMFFPRLFDRWVQNLRRCAGYKVQYFGAIEAQRRLAPHIHLAIRGAIPRATIRAVTRATYLQLWWPRFEPEDLVYPDPDEDPEAFPYWDEAGRCYRDPGTGLPLRTWEQALDDLDRRLEAGAEVEPAVVMRFGTQLDIAGIIAPSPDADRQVRYLTKYLTKDVAGTYTPPDGYPVDWAYERHIDRLWQQLRVIPCSPECSNWLRYGIQPKNAGPGLDRGACPAKGHQRDHLGIGGRRVQVSRAWSGKTLTEHRADRATVVREVLQAAGIDPPDADRMAADTLAADGLPRFVWDDLPVHEHDYVHVMLRAVAEAHRWRRQYDHAKQAAAARASPGTAA